MFQSKLSDLADKFQIPLFAKFQISTFPSQTMPHCDHHPRALDSELRVQVMLGLRGCLKLKKILGGKFLDLINERIGSHLKNTGWESLGSH